MAGRGAFFHRGRSCVAQIARPALIQHRAVTGFEGDESEGVRKSSWHIRCGL